MKFKTEFRLKKGFIIHIDGIPYEYLGRGMVGTNTSVDEIYDAATKQGFEDNRLTPNTTHKRVL